MQPAILNSQHPRLMEFYVENPNMEEPTSMMMFLNIEKDFSYILSINESFSLLETRNGNRFVIYGKGKVHNTRYIYGLTRVLNNKNVDYFSDRIIRPSLNYYFDDSKFDLEDVHLDRGQVFGVLFSLNSENAIQKFEENDFAINYAFGSKEEYFKSKDILLKNRQDLGVQLQNFANLNSFERFSPIENHVEKNISTKRKRNNDNS